MRGGFFRKLLLLAMAATLTAVVAVNLAFTYTAENVIIEGLGAQAAEFAQKAVRKIDSAGYADLVGGRISPKAARIPLVEELRWVQSELGPYGVENIYVIAPRGQVLYLLADTSDDQPAFTATDEINTALKFGVLQKGVVAFTSTPYVDEWGTWISGYAPVVDAAGQPIAVLGVDLPLGAFPLMNEIIQRNLLITLIPATLLALGLSIYFSRRLVRPVNQLISGLTRVAQGDFRAQISLSSGDEFEQIASSFNAMSQGLTERERIRSVFHQAVSKEIAEEMLNGDLKLEGETRELTVLFTDLRGFTSMSEDMSPDDVISMLNEYFSIMAPIVPQHGGVIDKFVGDEIMAIFGAPLGLDNPSAAAISCALEMLDALDILNFQRAKRGLAPLGLGIGINTGAAVAGNVGAPDRLNYTVLGRTINIGARLCSKATAGQIIVGELTHHNAEKNFHFKPLTSMSVKGISVPLTTYEVLRSTEESS